jgi:tetratricopeptide (TPR) repeat protein
MEPERPRPGALSDLEARLLAAAVGKRLFQRPAEPVQLGRYRLLGRLGQGGMSVVFRAHDPQLRREVAVKLLHSSRGAPDPEHQARLRREAHALGRLSHPNVVQVFEIGEVDGQTFVVMELVRGTTLREWLRAGPHPLPEVVAMVAQAGRGLAAAHAAGIVHRDFKPENVLIGADGRARVVDFGLARASPGEGAPVEVSTSSLAAPLTRSGTVLGTPAFMAPEQLREAGRADARSDQFSFCVLLYEALYGERPFDDLTAAKVRPPPPGAQVPAALRAVLLRGLQHDPAERWPTMDALLDALAAATATPPPGEAAARAPSRRGRLAGAIGLGLAAAASLTAWLMRPDAAPPSPAQDPQALLAQLAADDLAAAERRLAELPDDVLASLADLDAGLPEAPAFARLRDLALAEQAARLLREGRVDAAAQVHMRRLSGERRREAAALHAALSALLAARTRLSPRFTGPSAAPWLMLEPAALRGDPVADALVVTTGAAPLLAAWSLELRGDRLLVALDLEPSALDPEASFTLRIAAAEASAELALRAAAPVPPRPSAEAQRIETEEPALQLVCGDGAGVPFDRAASLSLRLDIDASRGTVECSALGGRGELLARAEAPLSGRLAPGPASLELRGGESRLRARVTRLELLGALPRAQTPADPLARAGALLVDGDAHAAATALAALDGPQARLWQAIALIRLGRWQEAAPQLEQALAGERAAELQTWLRADPRGLAPALRQLLGEPRYLDLFFETWRPELDAPQLPAEFVRLALAELGGIDERCEGRRCAALRRAYGRALAQIGELARARRALESALAAAPDDADGRALASQLVLDLALVTPAR